MGRTLGSGKDDSNAGGIKNKKGMMKRGIKSWAKANKKIRAQTGTGPWKNTEFKDIPTQFGNKLKAHEAAVVKARSYEYRVVTKNGKRQYAKRQIA